jgi:hypothetical protein
MGRTLAFNPSISDMRPEPQRSGLSFLRISVSLAVDIGKSLAVDIGKM